MEGLPALTSLDSVMDVLESPVSRAIDDPSRQFKPKALRTRQEWVIE